MSFTKFVPIILAVILVVSVVGFAQISLPPPTTPTNVTLRVSYPDSLDESDVTDMYAFQQLATEGIHVIPTFYDAPPFSYKGLISGQQDISFGTNTQAFALGPGVRHQQTTCVAGYLLAGVFLSIAGKGITAPSQMLGKTTEDFGPGTSTRALNYFWFAQANTPVNTNAPDSKSVYLKAGGGNIARVHDLEAGVVQAIVVDDFILAQFQDPAINNTAHNGPFHVLFYAPNNYWPDCYAVRDDWLSQTANQQVLVKFIAALFQAQRYFISRPDEMVKFAQQQLPLTAIDELKFTSTFYPAHFTYWPYGSYNLLGDQSVEKKFVTTNEFYLKAGILSSPVDNSSVKPFGIVNKYFELQALQSLGPYAYPKSSWVTPEFVANVHSWVPSWMGGISAAPAGAQTSSQLQTNVAPATFMSRTQFV